MIVEERHGTLKDFVANWAEHGLDPDSRCFWARADDGVCCIVPYSPEFMDHGVNPDRHLRDMALVAMDDLRQSA